MATTNYTTFGDEIVYENRAGTESAYMRDPLGSTAALLNSSQTQTDTFFYWPFGEQRVRTGTTQIPFQFIGTLGYYLDIANTWIYVRARHIVPLLGRWLTVDPLWPDQLPYAYAESRPTVLVDPSGYGCYLRGVTFCCSFSFNIGKCSNITAIYCTYPGWPLGSCQTSDVTYSICGADLSSFQNTTSGGIAFACAKMCKDSPLCIALCVAIVGIAEWRCTDEHGDLCVHGHCDTCRIIFPCRTNCCTNR